MHCCKYRRRVWGMLAEAGGANVATAISRSSDRCPKLLRGIADQESEKDSQIGHGPVYRSRLRSEPNKPNSGDEWINCSLTADLTSTVA